MVHVRVKRLNVTVAQIFRGSPWVFLRLEPFRVGRSQPLARGNVNVSRTWHHWWMLRNAAKCRKKNASMAFPGKNAIKIPW